MKKGIAELVGGSALLALSATVVAYLVARDAGVLWLWVLILAAGGAILLLGAFVLGAALVMVGLRKLDGTWDKE